MKLKEFLDLYPEDIGNRYIRNIGNDVPGFTASHTRRQSVDIMLQNRSTDGRCPEVVISVKKPEARGKTISVVTTAMRVSVRHDISVRESVRHDISVRESVRHDISVRESVRHDILVRESVRHDISVRVC
jgi:hypothetical protein